MGLLSFWELPPEFVERFPVFVETGTGAGESLAYAAQHGFRRLYTTDTELVLVQKATERFACDGRIACSMMPSWFYLSVYADSGSFFWLDAHFPGSDHCGAPWDCEPDMAIRFPLESELQAIRHAVPSGDYAILIDDLRFYDQDLDCEEGPMPAEQRHLFAGLPTLGDLLRPFLGTHDIEIDRRNAGYAVIVPKGSPRPCPRK